MRRNIHSQQPLSAGSTTKHIARRGILLQRIREAAHDSSCHGRQLLGLHRRDARAPRRRDHLDLPGRGRQRHAPGGLRGGAAVRLSRRGVVEPRARRARRGGDAVRRRERRAAGRRLLCVSDGLRRRRRARRTAAGGGHRRGDARLRPAGGEGASPGVLAARRRRHSGLAARGASLRGEGGVRVALRRLRRRVPVPRGREAARRQGGRRHNAGRGARGEGRHLRRLACEGERVLFGARRAPARAGVSGPHQVA